MRVAIVGAGGVGSSAAFNLLRLGGHEIVLVDRSEAMVASHVLDLEQAALLGRGGAVRGGGVGDLGGADAVVFTASAPLTVNTSRLVYLEANRAIVAEVLSVLPAGWGGILLMVTNPVDALCTWLHRQRRFDHRRLLGYTLNDSLRLRSGIARARGVPQRQVEAWVLGEHGDHAVPLLDRVQVGGRPVDLTPTEAAEAVEFLRGWYARHVALDSGRSSTWTTGLGIARTIEAIARGSEEVWPVSVVLEGEYGVDGVSLGVPVTLGPGGVARIHEWELDDDQRAALLDAAEAVRSAADRLDAAGL